jgi:hypothetical protein
MGMNGNRLMPENMMDQSGNSVFQELMTESELIEFLRIPIVSKAGMTVSCLKTLITSGLNIRRPVL